MSRKTENTAFTCLHCGRQVLPLTNGSFRDHCPFCLYSLHVDEEVGDRMSGCRCQKCGHEQVNKIAQDTVQPDDMNRICSLMKNV